jgi:hypothetical protein
VRGRRAHAPAGPSHHARIEIESIDARGTEALEDQLGTHTAPASQLERRAPVHRATHPKQLGCLDVTLDRRANGVVHERELEPVQQHGCGWAFVIGY